MDNTSDFHSDAAGSIPAPRTEENFNRGIFVCYKTPNCPFPKKKRRNKNTVWVCPDCKMPYVLVREYGYENSWLAWRELDNKTVLYLTERLNEITLEGLRDEKQNIS